MQRQIYLIEDGYRWLKSALSDRRDVCIWLAALVLFSYLAFPPWEAVKAFNEESGIRRFEWDTVKLGRSIVTVRPPDPDEYTNWIVSIDYARMAMELLACESLVVALYLTWGRKQSGAHRQAPFNPPAPVNPRAIKRDL